MFAFPAGTNSDQARSNMEKQLSFFVNMSKNWIQTCMRVNELNIEASRKLLDESAAALKKGLQIKSLGDAQSLVAEQSQLTFDRVRGYGQNVRNIATESWSALEEARNNQAAATAATTVTAAPSADDTATTAAAVNAANATNVVTSMAANAASTAKSAAAPDTTSVKAQTDNDTRPSTLMEKMVASVATDARKAH